MKKRHQAQKQQQQHQQHQLYEVSLDTITGAQHHSHSHPHHCDHCDDHRLPRPPAVLCPFPVKFITFVIIYFATCFVVVLYSTVQLQLQQREVRVLVTMHQEWHPAKREDRFPSIEERVKLYMSSWYLPACQQGQDQRLKFQIQSRKHNSTLLHVQASSAVSATTSLQIDGVVDRNRLMYWNDDLMRDCSRSSTAMAFQHAVWGRDTPTEKFVFNRKLTRNHCLRMYMVNLVHQQGQPPSSGPMPLVTYIGNNYTSLPDSLPVLGTSRPAVRSKAVMDSLTSGNGGCVPGHASRPKLTVRSALLMPPIILLLDRDHVVKHIMMMASRDYRWEQKEPKAVWRGLYAWEGFKGDVEKNERKCRSDRACRFVVNHVDSPRIDAGYDATAGFADQVLDGVLVTKLSANARTLQRHKVLIHLEQSTRNYDPSSLAWKLYSRSVVVMYPPTTTSWLMEELLEPWVHYIPINETETKADTLVEWVINNDEAACKIAERASLFIQDLFNLDESQDQTKNDDQEVQQEIMRRYRTYWNI